MRGACVLACLVPFAAAAHNVSDEVLVGRAQATADVPATSDVSNLLSASFDVGDSWAVTGTARVTAESSTGPPAGATGWNVGGTVAGFSVGAECDVQENLTVGVAAFAEPRIEVNSVATLTATRSVLIEATDSNAALELYAEYDTANEFSDSNVEWFFAGSIAGNHYETDQQVGGAVFGGQQLTPAQLRLFCAAANACSRRLRQALDGNHSTLDSLRFSGSALATVLGDTDVGLSGDFYGYAQDPRNAGYFLGVGPIAPLRWLVRPEVTERFGDFSLRAWGQVGRYAGGTAQSTAGLGLKGQYRFAPFRVWLSVTGQSDVDEQGATSRSIIFALGGGWRF